MLDVLTPATRKTATCVMLLSRAPTRHRTRLRNLGNYITRALLDTGGFRPDYTLFCDEPDSLVRWLTGVAFRSSRPVRQWPGGV